MAARLRVEVRDDDFLYILQRISEELRAKVEEAVRRCRSKPSASRTDTDQRVVVVGRRSQDCAPAKSFGTRLRWGLTSSVTSRACRTPSSVSKQVLAGTWSPGTGAAPLGRTLDELSVECASHTATALDINDAVELADGITSLRRAGDRTGASVRRLPGQPRSRASICCATLCRLPRAESRLDRAPQRVSGRPGSCSEVRRPRVQGLTSRCSKRSRSH